MAKKTFYRGLHLESGTIRLWEGQYYGGIIWLDEIEVEYDDVLTEEHREMLIKAIEKNIKEKTEKHNAEMFKLNQLRDQLLLLENKGSESSVEGEFIPADNPPPVDFDDDIPF